MTIDQLIFLAVALATLFAAFRVVTTGSLIHAAFWLIATLFGVAVTFAVLHASFLAVVQVVVYIGAIAILFIFAVMLTRKEMQDSGPQVNRNWRFGAALAAMVFVGLVFLVQGWSGVTKAASAFPSDFDAVAALGNALVSPDAFVLPFEVASVLLVAALIGAVYVAYNRK
ncbi:MAG: NADH-quinone oxidoreductase subunit J [Anaerolineales bacterium]|nr:NADH-quinone oxidoreductase subunit J [Anaerolineales bacterium]